MGDEIFYRVAYEELTDSTYREITVFTTPSEEVAMEYINKFNFKLARWRGYYTRYEDLETGYIKDEYSIRHFHRWYKLNTVLRAFCQKTSIRN
jgi:hypothetical protein